MESHLLSTLRPSQIPGPSPVPDRILRAMKQANYKGYIGVEYVWIDWEHCNEVDNLSETIQMRDYFRSAFL